MGGRPKVMQIPVMRPPAPVDESDDEVVLTSNLMLQRARAAMLGYRRTFANGPRGPGDVEWADPIVGKPPVSGAAPDQKAVTKQKTAEEKYNNLPGYKKDVVEDPAVVGPMTPAEKRSYRQRVVSNRKSRMGGDIL